MPRALIFDLDGTLVESLPGIARALNHALADRGLPGHDEATIRRFIGNGSWKLCERGAPDLPELEIGKLEQEFRDHYANTWQGGTQPFPGIREVLDQLAADNTLLAVFSNKPHRFTADIVAALFPDVPFRAVLGQRDGIPGKPDPAGALEILHSLAVPAGEAVYVGDSTVDHETAINTGMLPLLVDWGYHDRSALVGLGAPVVSSADQLPAALAALHRGD